MEQLKKRCPWMTRPNKSDINYSLFIMNPLNPRVKDRPITTSKIKLIEFQQIKKLKQDQQNTIKVNCCTWVKLNGQPCGAKLKWGNCYCMRHLKMKDRS